jgi:GNAT superfamily N-acetyltransferase
MSSVPQDTFEKELETMNVLTSKKQTCELIRVNPSNWSAFQEHVMRIENDSYEPSRQTPLDSFNQIVRDSLGVVVAAEIDQQIAGFCFAAPLEGFPDVEGTQVDPQWGKRNTLYAVDLTVAHKFRRKGIGRLLKGEQIRIARTAGYSYIAGRTRVGLAEAMIRLNASFGAQTLVLISDAYRDGLTPDVALYYHIALKPTA